MRGMMILPNGQVVKGKAPKNIKNADRYTRKMMGKQIDFNKEIMRDNRHQEVSNPEVVETLNK